MSIIKKIIFLSIFISIVSVSKTFADDLKKIGKFDVLIHFASEGTKTDERNNLKKNFQVNVFDSKELILKAIENNCKKFMIISSSSEFGTININTNGVKRNDFKFRCLLVY